jgi:hypothetical protein
MLPRPTTPDEKALLEARRENDSKYGDEVEEFNLRYLKYELSISPPEEAGPVLAGIRKFSIPLEALAGSYISRGSGLLPAELENLRSALSDGRLEENQKLTKFILHSNRNRGKDGDTGYQRTEMCSTSTWEPTAIAYSRKRVRRFNEETGRSEEMAIRTVFDILIDNNHPPKGFPPDFVLFGPHNEISLSDENTYTTVNIDSDEEGIVRIRVDASFQSP